MFANGVYATKTTLAYRYNLSDRELRSDVRDVVWSSFLMLDDWFKARCRHDVDGRGEDMESSYALTQDVVEEFLETAQKALEEGVCSFGKYFPHDEACDRPCDYDRLCNWHSLLSKWKDGKEGFVLHYHSV